MHYVQLLKRDGTMTLVGAPEQPHPAPSVLSARFRTAGDSQARSSAAFPETQEMLDFCAERDITCDVEMIAMQDIDHAYDRMLKSDVKYRFVIDMATFT